MEEAGIVIHEITLKSCQPAIQIFHATFLSLLLENYVKHCSE